MLDKQRLPTSALSTSYDAMKLCKAVPVVVFVGGSAAGKPQVTSSFEDRQIFYSVGEK